MTKKTKERRQQLLLKNSTPNVGGKNSALPKAPRRITQLFSLASRSRFTAKNAGPIGQREIEKSFCPPQAT